LKNRRSKGGLQSVVFIFILTGSLFAGERARFGLGYDEGIAVRYFFSDQMGIQAGLSFENLGGYDATPNNGGRLEPETNFGLSGAFLFTLFGGEHIYLDGFGQIAVAHNGTRDPNDLGDRNLVLVRLGLAPEILVGSHLGFGFRFGFEFAAKGETKEDRAGVIVETDDGVLNTRFYGPRNPFAQLPPGAQPLLGLALFVYFDFMGGGFTSN